MIGKELIDWTEAFMSYIPGKIGTFTRMCWYRYRWKKPANVRIRAFSEFIHSKNILFLGNASLGKSAFFSAQGGEIEIGNNFSCNVNVHINASGGGKLSISDDVMIGPNVVIRTANHGFDSTDTPYNKQGHNYADIVIGKNVWIGANVVILNNIEIGDNSIIGAGAIVTKDIPKNVVAGGVPAIPLRKLNA
jgi:galactoside O-acetyltransferase